MSAPPSSSYDPPSWSAPSGEGWRLLEIKGGVEVASHSLEDKRCVLLGRAADQVDIPLQHESCSRRHARIAFDKENGTPWLRDLGSTHGTKVNRKALPPQAIGSTESDSKQAGARGVVLFVGDVLQFGASTRMFCLEGPPEYERGAAALQKKTAFANPVIQDNKPQEEEHVLSRRSDLEADYGESLPNSDAVTAKQKSMVIQKLDPRDVPEKHQKLWERLRAKQFKLSHIQQESERIRAKGELTEGQQNQLAKNAEKEAKLHEEIEEIEQELHDKLFGEQGAGESRTKSHREDDGDVDDFYDRTKDDTRRHDEEGESEQSLITKWKTLHSEWTGMNAPLKHAQKKVETLEERMRKAKEADDEDAFFLQNDLDLASDELERAKGRRLEIELSMNDTEQLLRIVNGQLVVDRLTGFIGDKSDKPSDPDPKPQKKPPVDIREEMSSDSIGTLSKPVLNDAMLPPPPKRVKVAEPSSSMPPPRIMPPPPPSRAKKQASPAPIGTLSVLSSSRSEPKRKNDEEEKRLPKVPGFDEKLDVWRAPKDQDGSGKTRLNKKFAGRY